jgi:transcriptional regulator with XRE-family HTH domain
VQHAVKFRKENKMPGLGEVDMKLVGDLVRQKRKRENMSLREAAVQVRISAPTLQRVETGQLPTASVLVRVADWLGVKVDDLRQRPSESPRGTVAQIEIFLRADPNLDRKAAAAIANIVREVYDGLVKGKKGK